MDVSLIEEHYRANYNRLIKRMSFRAKTLWAAEDIVQTAYERAIRYKDVATVREFPRWFSIILENSFIDYMNVERGYSPLPEDYDEVVPEEFGKYRDVMREIFELIETKSVAQVEVLTLFFRYKYSAKHISEITPYSHDMIRKIISRFKKELETLYKD